MIKFAVAILLPVAFVVLGIQSASAAKLSIACIQNQLNEAGFDAGPADGLIGRRTRGALDDFFQERAPGGAIPLTDGTASAICRRIGLISPDLAAFWPSQSSALVVVSGEDVPAPVARLAEKFAHDIYSQTTERFGVEMAGTDRIVIGSSPAELRTLISQHSSIKLNGLSAVLDDACSSFRNMSGRAAPGLVYICVNPEATLGREIALDWIQFLLAHEITHVIQYQLAGGLPTGDFSERERLNLEGPMWLIEGLAQVVANKTSTSADEAHYRNVMLSRFEGKELPDLADLESRRAVEQRRPDVYRAGAIAATDLVEAHGYRALGDLYDKLGMGIPWDEAFELQFGQTPGDFYRAFDARHDS